MHKTFTGNLAVLSAKSFQPVRYQCLNFFALRTILLFENMFPTSELYETTLISTSVTTIQLAVLLTFINMFDFFWFGIIAILKIFSALGVCLFLILANELLVEGGLDGDLQDNIHRDGKMNLISREDFQIHVCICN